jgi:hypothetical protein
MRLPLDRYAKLLLLSVLLAGISRTATGQHPSSLQTGVRVRLRSTSTGKEWHQGNLLQIGGDSLTLGTESDTLSFAARSVTKLEVSRGRKSNVDKGAKIGAGVGVGLGIIASAAVASDDDCFCSDITAGDVILLTALFGATGTGIGALIGSASHSERWAKVEQPWVSVRVQPMVKRTGLLLAMRF